MTFSVDFFTVRSVVFNQSCVNWLGNNCSAYPTYINNAYNSYNKFNGSIIGYNTANFTNSVYSGYKISGTK